jgi:hypothetical protein
MVTKVCNKCSTTKPVDDFYKNRSKHDGLETICKTCKKVYYSANRSTILDNKKKSYKKDSDTKKAYNKGYWKENKASLSKKNKQWRQANKEHVKRQMEAYRVRHKERLSARGKVTGKVWRANNKDKIAEKHARRRARIKNQSPPITNLEKSLCTALYWMSRVLSNSCNEPFHVDHIQPISKGGLHVFDNLQILSAEENLSKHTKWEK